MPIAFTKMHGLGNDYVYVNCFEQSLDGLDIPNLSRAMSDRHRGIGSDGLILITPPSPGVRADVWMQMYNSDGSRSEMCGNGLRCVAKYAAAHGLGNRDGRRLLIQTDRGICSAEVSNPRGSVSEVKINMGRPILAPHEIPVLIAGERCVMKPVAVGGKQFDMTCVSMGNPHACMFVADVRAIDLAKLGPLVEHHELFPNRVNAHFAQVNGRREVTIRTWERGAGATQACGSGACATAVAGVLEGRLDTSVTTHLPGGDLRIDWPDTNSEVFMTGPAEEVFSGEWPA